MITGVIWMSAQVLAAGAGLVTLRQALESRALTAATNDDDASGVVFDVLLPAAVVLPLLAGSLRTPGAGATNSVAEVNWLGIGGPVYCGLLGVLMLAMAGFTRAGRPAGGGDRVGLPASLYLRWIGAAVASGVVLVLLAATDELAPFVGQCALPIVAVLMWMNSPDQAPQDRAPSSARAGSVSIRVGLVVALAFGQLVAAHQAGPAWQSMTGAIGLLWAVGIVGLTHRFHSSVSSCRVGAWAAVYGPLLALTAMALSAAAVQGSALWRGEPAGPLMRVGTGFGRFGAEAVALLLLPIIAHGLLTLAPRTRVTLAGAALGVATAAAAYRLMMPG